MNTTNKIIAVLSIIAVILLILVIAKPHTANKPDDVSTESPLVSIATPDTDRTIANDISEDIDTTTTDELLPIDIPLSMSESATINGVTITFNRVLSDSRCPKDTTCIWEGEVRAVLSLQSSNSETKNIEISPRSPAVDFGGMSVTLVSVSPEPADKPIAQKDYSVLVRIEEAVETSTSNDSIAESCRKSKNGSWNQQYRECTGITESACTTLQGKWNECASACRHQSAVQACTQQCELVCEFK